MEPTTAPTTEPIDWNVLLPDIPAVTEPAAKPEVMNTEALVYTLYDYTLVWNDSQGKNKQITFQIPAIVPFCEGAIEINEAIRKAFQYDVVAARTCYEMQWSTSTVGIYYAVSLHDNVLSIRTFETTIVFGTEERHWALDLTTGKQLSTQGFAEKYLQESYPVFLEHCTHNLIQWFAANPLSDPNQQDRLMKCLANEVHAIGAYTLYLDFDGTLTLDLQIDAFRINGITYSTINDDSWVGDTASGYHWLFALKTDGEYGDHKARLLLDSFFADPTEFVTMLSEEEAATILDIADSLNYGLSPQDMDRYRQLCDDIYTVSPKDSKIAVTASILYRIAQPL